MQEAPTSRRIKRHTQKTTHKVKRKSRHKLAVSVFCIPRTRHRARLRTLERHARSLYEHMYKNSKGVLIDPKDMPDVYLERALAKAKREGDQANIDALQTEYDDRNGTDPEPTMTTNENDEKLN